MSSQDEEVGY